MCSSVSYVVDVGLEVTKRYQKWNGRKRKTKEGEGPRRGSEAVEEAHEPKVVVGADGDRKQRACEGEEDRQRQIKVGEERKCHYMCRELPLGRRGVYSSKYRRPPLRYPDWSGSVQCF